MVVERGGDAFDAKYLHHAKVSDTMAATSERSQAPRQEKESAARRFRKSLPWTQGSGSRHPWEYGQWKAVYDKDKRYAFLRSRLHLLWTQYLEHTREFSTCLQEMKQGVLDFNDRMRTMSPEDIQNLVQHGLNVWNLWWPLNLKPDGTCKLSTNFNILVRDFVSEWHDNMLGSKDGQWLPKSSSILRHYATQYTATWSISDQTVVDYDAFSDWPWKTENGEFKCMATKTGNKDEHWLNLDAWKLTKTSQRPSRVTLPQPMLRPWIIRDEHTDMLISRCIESFCGMLNTYEAMRELMRQETPELLHMLEPSPNAEGVATGARACASRFRVLA